jgi:hypothetical protein
MEKPQEEAATGRRRADAGRRADVSPGPSAPRPSHARVMSTPAYLHPGVLTDGERQPLLRARSMDDNDIQDDSDVGPVAGGTVLGIHNLAIVMPQFLVSGLTPYTFTDRTDRSLRSPSSRVPFSGSRTMRRRRHSRRHMPDRTCPKSLATTRTCTSARTAWRGCSASAASARSSRPASPAPCRRRRPRRRCVAGSRT